ncbi:hypothetical protein [Clostridium niameyense]|uniref:hypothetical protein n=1 Tax=Clostridium niameyense TaxID=1622073 RepID=UPI001FAE5D89|nr:hypothetical protein [Clostridium niameyense]
MNFILEEERESRGWRYRQLKIDLGDERVKQIKHCAVCGTSYKVELHHVIFKSECRALANCKHNFVYLCGEHHRGNYGPHGKQGKDFNRKLKLEFQNWLEKTFSKDRYTLEEIQKKLDISLNATRSLSKLMKIERGMFTRIEVIKACMGGKLY